jgi:hypothetical protein
MCKNRWPRAIRISRPCSKRCPRRK